MTSDTRNNLIFIAIVLALIVPGAVILFKNKLDPAAKALYLPDTMPRSTAYMSTVDTPPEIVRIVPPLTRAFLLAEARRSQVALPEGAAGAAAMFVAPTDARGDVQPIISRARRFEVVAVRSDGRIAVLIWDETVRPSSRLEFEIREEDRTTPVNFTASAIELPANVQKELARNGLFKAPARLTWVEISHASGSPKTPFSVSLRYTVGDETRADSAVVTALVREQP